ncbi:MAG: hypothetical protein R2853_10895 [Thermomicrobiales bacterium]
MAVTQQIEGEDLVVRLADWSRWVAPNRGFAGRMYAGTWQSKGATGFWMVTNPRETVVIASSSQRSYGWLLDVDDQEGGCASCPRSGGRPVSREISLSAGSFPCVQRALGRLGAQATMVGAHPRVSS